MMGIMDKKRAVTAILGPESDNVGIRDGEGGDALSDCRACAEELLDAIKSEDASGIVSAFKGLLAACDSIDYGEE